MREAFDPHHEWLGIPSGQGPGNHYELLGIDPSESDLAAIARAADVLAARIRGIRPGPHLAEWQRLLDTVSGAKRCLLDPAAKAAYDASLRGQAASIPPRAAPVPVHATSPTNVPPTFPQNDPAGGLAAVRPGRRRARKAKPSAAQTAVYALTLFFIGVAALLAYKLYRQRQEVAAGQPPTSQTESRSSTEASDGRTQRPGLPKPPFGEGGSRSAGEAKPDPAKGPKSEKRPKSPGKTEPDKPTGTEPPADDGGQPAFKQALADARLAMSQRDLESARRHLARSAQEAKTPAERAEVDRLDTLLGHLEEFWKGMSRVVAGLTPTEELAVGETFVAVVEASAEELTVKVAGQLRTYTIDRIPSRLVQALADLKLARDPTTKVLLGAYLLVDPKGDPARARQLWEEAAREGVDLKDLMPELDQWRAESPAPGAPTTEKTAPPADPQKLHQAEQAVREKFKAEYDQATSVAGKGRLATLLLKTGRATSDDLDLRFVLLREARDLAAAGGDSELACAAVDDIANSYQVDVLGMKTAVLAEAAKNARGLNSQKQVAQSALELLAEAVESQRLEEARQLADVALAAARKSNSRTLMQQAMLVVQQVEALEKQAEP